MPNNLSHPPFFRSALFQILIFGLCAFCALGIWSAMTGLGVGGSQSPSLVNATRGVQERRSIPNAVIDMSC
jgi:hypothetical protein